MVHHNVKNEITNDLHLAILAIVRLPTHPNPVDLEAVAHLGMELVRTALGLSQKSRSPSNLKQFLERCKWAMVARTRTPRPRWRE